nr:unnamed protein product [Spirometra erinaceieuropaei]
MYRVGDFVFFEASATTPYQIRRIDELNKTPTGAVEAKVTCYYRRRDISSNLIQQAEKYYFQETDSDQQTSSDANGGGCHANSLTDIQRHQIKHRELFLSRQVECLPATHIRGKCSVTLYNDVEPLTSYVQREDAFYYRLIYDPSTKRLQEDRGSMRIGSDYQSEIQPLLKKGEKDPRFKEKLEELVWDPALSLSASDTDLFISLTKAVGLYARSCDPTNCQPYLLNATATASRDVTLQYAHDILFKANYDLKKAMLLLLPDGRPSLCRDELETWTAGEAALFEEALEKYSKFFPDILTDFLPWKTPKSIVELYYFWKTTERYTRHRRNKMTSHEHKLKQVYIPNYSKPNSAVLYNRNDSTDRGCACCHVESSPQWYAWGPPHLMCRLCSGCWTYWKKYGGLKNPDKRATPKLSKLQDPVSALRRKITVPPLSVALKKVLALKSIILPAGGDVAVRSPTPLKRPADCALGSINGECQAMNGKTGEGETGADANAPEATTLLLPPPEKKRFVELSATNCCSNESTNATTNGNRTHIAASPAAASAAEKLASK